MQRKITIPEVEYESRTYDKLTLDEIRKVNPKYDKWLRDEVFKKYTDIDGYYLSAKKMVLKVKID